MVPVLVVALGLAGCDSLSCGTPCNECALSTCESNCSHVGTNICLFDSETCSMTPERQRRWLGLFVALSLLSLGLNGYFVWRLYRYPLRSWAAQWRTVPPVRPDDHTRGPADATATVIVYSDFDCPYCRRLHLNLQALLETDRFRWVYRHAPRHPRAERMAETSECAARQGGFWQLADSLCATPVQGGTPEELLRRVQAVGLDAAQLKACLESGEGAPRVREQEKEARDLWISGTPTLYVNGHRHVGLLGVEELRRLLRETSPQAR